MGKWFGTFKGEKGYKSYKLTSSNCISYYGTPSARYSKYGVFEIMYRRSCPMPNKKKFIRGFREILPFNKFIYNCDYNAGAATIQLYTRINEQPSVEIMEKLEEFLKNGVYYDQEE